jgi:hypothetical protein
MKVNIKKEFVLHFNCFSHSQGMNEERRMGRQTCEDVAPHILSITQAKLCDQHLTIEKLFVALLKIIDDKALGLYGFHVIFTKTFGTLSSQTHCKYIAKQ